MPEVVGLGRGKPECRRLEVEPTAEHAAGSNTAAVAVVVVVVVVVVVEELTTVEQCNNTQGYTLGNIVENSCQDSFLQKDVNIQVKSFYFILHYQCYRARKRYNYNEIIMGSCHFTALRSKFLVLLSHLVSQPIHGNFFQKKCSESEEDTSPIKAQFQQLQIF